MMKKELLSLALLAATAIGAHGNTDDSHLAPGNGNPMLPGYFADPTIKKFGDTYYIYATTDGSGAGFGPAQCWKSRDLRNWTLVPMNWPVSHWIWAPDVMQHTDGKYYMVYCQPCNLYIGQADTPTGPWHNYLDDRKPQSRQHVSGPQSQALGKDFDNEGQPIWVHDRYVTGAITLDGQTFVDDDGSVYAYWGTWGIYEGFGCGAGKATSDLKSFSETHLIPNTEVKDFFEAPFVLKRNGIYYFMYSSGSCHTDTYHVQYATSRSPMGPYEYKGTILKTNADGTVHGPGHHSVLQDGDDYYIVYHRHDNPHSTRGFHRQVCIDKLEFDAEGNILPVTPTHTGAFPLLPSTVKSANLAYNARVTASSHYDADFKPEYAVDDNNGTLWRPRSMGREWLQIDLGKMQRIQTVWTQWEYGTQFYQYIIETSRDGSSWTLFSDRSHNRQPGSPMCDIGDVKARYVRITFTGAQKVGYPGALWNVKVFGGREEVENLWADVPEQGMDEQPVIDINASDFTVGDTLEYIPNHGSLVGGFESLQGVATAVEVEGKVVIPMDSTTIWASDFAMPALWRDNVPYHLEATLLNPSIDENECVADFTSSHDELEKVMLCNGTEPRCGVVNHYGWYEDVGYKDMAALAGKWQHIVVDFDGRIERVTINGILVSERDIQIMVKPVQRVLLGRNAEHEWPFSGYLQSLTLKMK